MAELLNAEGKLVGLLFNAPLNEDHPPYGGTIKEYVGYFEPYFEIEIMEPCYNSIEPRSGREVWIKMLKKG
jgi:thiopurine S-methyltransferase